MTMTQHNIVGHEQSGPHCVVRRFKPVRRRTFMDVVLSAIGGLTVLILTLTFVWTALSQPCC